MVSRGCVQKSWRFVRPRQFQEYVYPGVRNSRLILSLWTIIFYRKLCGRYLTVVKKNSNIFFRCFVFYLTTAVLRKRIRLSEIKYTSTFLRIREKSHKFVRPRQFQEIICPGVRNSRLILSLWTIIFSENCVDEIQRSLLLFRILSNDQQYREKR